MQGPVRVLSTLAVKGAMQAIAPRFQAQAGVTLDVAFAPTNAILERIRSGEAADVAIVTAAAVQELVRLGTLRMGSEACIAISAVGVAVKAGAAKPDISSVPAFKSALLAARSVAYSRLGASGVFFAGLIERLGISGEVNRKARIVPTGFTAELVAAGEAELAVQQISELLAVPGVEIVGALPAGIESITTFSAAVFIASGQAEAAGWFVRFLAGEDAKPFIEASGLRSALAGV